jgi:hypothetical protein
VADVPRVKYPNEHTELVSVPWAQPHGRFTLMFKGVKWRPNIVYDRFHVSQALNQAVDEVRRAENKALLAEGDERLKGTRQTWLFNPEPPRRSA